MNDVYLLDLSDLSLAFSRKVLIVEDDPLWQLIIERSLKRIDSNIAVLAVSSVDEALQKFQAKIPFDLVIADQALLGFRTGLDLWDHLLEHRTVVPFILMSGTEREEFQNALAPFREHEIPIYLEKTMEIKKLTEKIKRLAVL